MVVVLLVVVMVVVWLWWGWCGGGGGVVVVVERRQPCSPFALPFRTAVSSNENISADGASSSASVLGSSPTAIFKLRLRCRMPATKLASGLQDEPDFRESMHRRGAVVKLSRLWSSIDVLILYYSKPLLFLAFVLQYWTVRGSGPF